eukprot:TRINITY_DN451_c0_g1_i2.p1 TRINITY_DN451_c0_g1~~TRINITY_DN451_c0_g1_i2.p1  ORF type:complete len:381 (-),score=229.92 TRINITY_DN451_c0_g1_i2:89-1156(-)
MSKKAGTPFNTPIADNKFPKKRDEEEDSEEDETTELAREIQRSLTVTSPEEFIKSLTPAVQRRVKALTSLEEQYKKLNAQYEEEIRQLRKKYEEMYKPLYTRRSEIVTGASEPTAEEAPAVEGAEAGDIKGIPEFWLRAMLNNDILSSTITERDQGALKFLQNVAVEDIADNKGFRLVFTFTENEYFDNATLVKSYHLSDEEDDVLDRIEGTPIQWKPKKDLTTITIKKKQRRKGGKETRTVEKQEPCDSFFHFFSPPPPPVEDSADEDMQEDYQNLLEMDLEMGETIKEQVVPLALSYYTGAIERDEDYDEDEEDFDEDEDEDEDEEEEEAPKGKKGGAKGGQPAAQQQECKQQ